jgi:hypothetical protein
VFVEIYVINSTITVKNQRRKRVLLSLKVNPNNTQIVEAIAADKTDDLEDAAVVPGVQMRASAWQQGIRRSNRKPRYDRRGQSKK